MLFNIYIASHTDAPDFEYSIEAKNKEEAVETAYEMLHGEFDRDYLSNCIEEDQEAEEALQADMYENMVTGN